MIILDLQQVMLSNLLVSLGSHTNVKIEEDLLRHMILNTIRSNKSKFREYGEMVIACDSKNNWRRGVFPYYKANRKKSREESDLDWNAVFEYLNRVRSELKEYFPYRVIEIETAEADDVIGTLVQRVDIPDETKLILSSDKDFIQLHNKNVKQYDPVRKRWITHEDPESYLWEHVIRGDAGDGVPNVLSPDDTFVSGARQKRINEQKFNWLKEGYIKQTLPLNIIRNFARNWQLIDLRLTPVSLSNTIVAEYQAQGGKDRSKLMPYFMKNKLKNLMESISDF